MFNGLSSKKRIIWLERENNYAIDDLRDVKETIKGIMDFLEIKETFTPAKRQIVPKNIMEGK